LFEAIIEQKRFLANIAATQASSSSHVVEDLQCSIWFDYNLDLEIDLILLLFM